MNDEVGLLTNLIANPVDVTVALVYADWLQEHEQENRAEFIRVSCELLAIPHPNANGVCSACETPAGWGHERDCEYVRLRQRQRDLWGIEEVRSQGQGPAFWDNIGGVGFDWYDTTRGFVTRIETGFLPFLNNADQILWHPSQHRPCPLTAQPIQTLRFIGDWGTPTGPGERALVWDRDVFLSWPGGSRRAPVTAPYEAHTIRGAVQQFWPWINFEFIPPVP